MPLSAVVTMLSKYQTDIRQAQTEVIQYLKNQTDAGDYRVNEIVAEVIPESKTVVSGGQYRVCIILAARDTNAKPQIFVNDAQITNPDGIFTAPAGAVGHKEINGKIVLKDPITGEPREYMVKSDYSVIAPAATIANEDMNVVYMGYTNRLSVSVPGFSSEQLVVSATNARLESKGGGKFICRPSSYDNVVVSVFAKVEGKSVPMGSGKFRVRALPNPTAFLRFKDANGNMVLYNPTVNKNIKLTRKNLAEADMVAEYEDGLLQAAFNISSFTVNISDGRGGFLSCIPRHMPRRGLPFSASSIKVCLRPDASSLAAASPKAPTPGNTNLSALLRTAGSSVRRASAPIASKERHKEKMFPTP